MGRTALTGGGRALLANPARNVVQPLMWDASLPMTVRQVAPQVWRVGKLPFRGGRWVASGLRGRGFNLPPNAGQTLKSKVAGVGRGTKNEGLEELLETPYEAGVTWAFTGTPDINSPLVIAANIGGFGATEGLGGSRRMRSGGHGSDTNELLPSPDPRFYQTPSGVLVPKVAGGNDAPETAVRTAEPPPVVAFASPNRPSGRHHPATGRRNYGLPRAVDAGGTPIAATRYTRLVSR